MFAGSGGSGPIFGSSGGANGGGRPGEVDGCPAVRQKPETVIVYKDATVTDTIYTSKPVALFIMQDRTGSMASGFPSGCSCSWDNSTAALQQFVADPRAAGLDIGLGFFGGPDKSACDGSDCGQPVVPIGPIAQTGPQIVSAMQGNKPNPLWFTPMECGMNGMINACLQFMAQSPTGEQCVVVLVTDGNEGDPDPCSNPANGPPDVPGLVKIVADGHAKGVTVYTLGLQGSSPALLDQIAAAGGTGQEINVGSGQQAFFDALNNIRQTVAVTTVTHQTTTTTVATPLPCEWSIPPVQAGATFNKGKVNIEFTPPGGAAQQFGYVDNLAACQGAGQNAWYYDDATNPTKVLVCPSTCDSLKNVPGSEVDIIFGCDTTRVPPH